MRKQGVLPLAAASAWAITVWMSSTPMAQGQPTRREDLSQFLPPGSGKAIVASQCSTCHDLAGTIRLRTSKGGWEAIVLDMVARGAPLMVEDADTVIAYLGSVFGPNSPPLLDANTATAEDLTKLPGITPAHAERIIARRKAKGTFGSREEVQAAAGLEKDAFEKIKWYIRAERGS